MFDDAPISEGSLRSALRLAEEQLRQSTQRLALLARISKLIVQDFQTEAELLGSVFSELAQAIGAELYFHYQPHDAHSMRLCASGGLSDDERKQFEKIQYGELLCGRVAQNKQPIILEDIAHTSAEGSDAVRAAGYGAYAGYPLLAGERLLGTVAFVTRLKTHFAGGEVEMLQTICDQVAATLERMRLAHELSANEERQRLALQGAGLGSWDVDLETGAGVWNDRQFELLGFEVAPDRASMALWEERLHPDDRERVISEIAKSRIAGAPVSIEHRIIRIDTGETRWLSLYGRFSSNQAGNAVRLSGVSQDITERKQSEAALYASEQRLALGTRVGGLALIEVDYKLGRSRLTPEASSLFGFGNQACEVSREEIHATFHPDDHSELMDKIAACLNPQGDGWFAMDHRIKRASDGEVLWLHVRKQVFFEGTGDQRAASYAMLAAVDITAERKAILAVHQSEAFTRSVLDSLPENVAVLDSKGVIVSVNEPWSKFAWANQGKQSAASPIGQRYLELFQREGLLEDVHARDAHSQLSKLLAGEVDSFALEYPCHSPERLQWFLMNGRRIQDAPFVLISHLEITGRKQAEERLQFITDQASVGQWFWDVPHNQLEWSPICKKLFGIAADEAMTYDRFLAAIHPDDVQRVNDLANSCLAGSTSNNEFDVEYRTVRTDGTTRWIHAKGSVTFSDGRPVTMAGIALDVTDRRKAQELVETHHQLLTTIFEYMPAAINIIRGSDLRLIMVNSGYRELAAGRGEPVGQTLDELWPETGKDFKSVCQQVLQTGVPHHAVDELVTIRNDKDGSLEQRWFTWSIFRIQLPADEGWGLFNTAWETTDRKRAELALRRNESRYRLLFENMSEGFALAEMIWDDTGNPIDYRYLEVNQAWEQTGISPDRAIGRTVREVVPGIEPMPLETLVPVVRNGESILYENFVEGLGRSFETFAFKHSDNCFGVLLRDITQRKRGETALQVAGESFRQLVERSPFGVYAVDADFRLTMVSLGAQRVFDGVHPLLGRDFAEVLRSIWPEPFASEAIMRFRDTLASGEPYHSTNTVERRADTDETEAYDWKLERVTLPDGRPGVVCHFYDLSERQRYEETLRVARNRLETAINASNVVLFHQDQDLRYTWIHNPALGYPAEEVTGKTDFDLPFKKEEADHIAAIKREVLTSGEPKQAEVSIEHNGSVRYYELFIQPDRDAVGKIVGINCAAIDITHRRDIEQLLRDSDRRKDEFLATLSHELRNPLATIRSGLEVLKLSNDQNIIRETCAMMERQSSQLVALVDDLLEISRISRGKINLRREIVSIGETVRVAVETCRPLISQSNHQLTIEIEQEEIYVSGDSNRLTQIVANLLNNAIKYTPANGHIAIRVVRENDTVHISVTDTGIGIPNDQLEKVFDLFAQIESASLAYNGLGVGLSLVKSLVELHHGTVWAESAGDQRGSTFHVRLPISTIGLLEVKPARAAEPSEVARRVLVVDDNAGACKLLALMIKLLGHEVASAFNGLEAVERAREFRPEIIFMDLGMPVMDGCAAAQSIRSEAWGASVTLIALTGWGQDVDKERTSEAGFDHHLVKPVEPTLVREMLAKFSFATRPTAEGR